MRTLTSVGLDDVRAVYSGAEGALWKLIMGAQIHVGGLKSSLDLATRANIQAASRGVDLCCCQGAGMQFLIRFRNVAAMTGVDATPAAIGIGKQRAAIAGLADRLEFVHADAVCTGLPAEQFDFAWGEDAWCYVADKSALIREAVRLVRPGGTVAFTDWVEGTTPLSHEEAERFMGFMKFQSLATLDDYAAFLERNGCSMECRENTGRFAPALDLYAAMIEQQLAYDALAILGFDHALLEAIGSELAFARRLAHDGKIAQCMCVAKKL